MTPTAFKSTLSHKAPPPAVPVPLAALWWAKKGEWDRAHRLVQSADGTEAAWVHAYLHRVEGDRSNAAYWYRQARQPAATGDLDAEWEALVGTLLHAPKKRTT